MTRGALLVLSLLACSAAPAFAQNSGSTDNSELLGGPGYQAAQEEAAKRAAARRQVENEIAEARARAKKQADAAAAARQADAKKADQARIARQAELAALEARLREKEQELAAEEERLAKLRAEIEGEEFAEASEGQRSAPVEGAAPEEPAADGPENGGLEAGGLEAGGRPMRLEASILSCAFAGEDKAIARDYLSARYVRPPRFFERGGGLDELWRLRGVMRVEDRRGAILADTVCELDDTGQVQYFAFVRP